MVNIPPLGTVSPFANRTSFGRFDSTPPISPFEAGVFSSLGMGALSFGGSWHVPSFWLSPVSAAEEIWPPYDVMDAGARLLGWGDTLIETDPFLFPYVWNNLLWRNYLGGTPWPMMPFAPAAAAFQPGAPAYSGTPFPSHSAPNVSIRGEGGNQGEEASQHESGPDHSTGAEEARHVAPPPASAAAGNSSSSHRTHRRSSPTPRRPRANLTPPKKEPDPPREEVPAPPHAQGEEFNLNDLRDWILPPRK